VKRFTVAAERDISTAVLGTGSYCTTLGLDETASRMVATAASELARNILKYAGCGELRVRLYDQGGRRGVEIEAIDRGPGIADAERALEDHFSSGGTLGLGLPGVRRLMDEFELASEPGRGTRVVARKWI
jgi:serine/threonine-protein kinase RsbT